MRTIPGKDHLKASCASVNQIKVTAVRESDSYFPNYGNLRKVALNDLMKFAGTG